MNIYLNFNKSLAIDTVTITDLTDAIVSVEEPTDPTNGTLWIDISTGEDEGILKQYIIRDGEDKGQWVTVKLNMEYLNPELSETVKFVNKQLTDMGDDGLLTYGERVELSKMIAEITGESPSTTTTITVGYKTSLPTPATLDSGGSGGTFFKYRYSARQVGINEGKDKGNPIYANLENAYNELNDYLSQFTPKPWDITINNKDLVVELGSTADKLREVFLNYYTAALALSELTKERGVEVSKEYTDEGIDNISIGGTNLISSEKAKEGIGLDSKGSEISNILYNTSDFIEVVGGKDYSMSIFTTPQTENEFIKYAWYDSNRTFISSGGLTDTSKTIKAPENAKYIRVAYLKDIKPKFEVGNKPTDWSPNPDDIESQIEHTQASLTVTSNAIRGIVLETIGGSEVATIDEKTGEIVYVDTKKTRLSQIEQKADSITSIVSENTGAISKIEQKVGSISSTVSNHTGAISQIEQKVGSITTTVSSQEKLLTDHSNKLSEHTNSISSVEQKADSITSTVSSMDTRLSTKISQTDNRISLLVTGSSEETSSFITMLEGRIKLKASSIDLTGYVTLSELSNENSKTEINGNHIKTGTISSVENKTWINLETGEFSFMKGALTHESRSTDTRGAVKCHSSFAITYTSNINRQMIEANAGGLGFYENTVENTRIGTIRPLSSVNGSYISIDLESKMQGFSVRYQTTKDKFQAKLFIAENIQKTFGIITQNAYSVYIIGNVAITGSLRCQGSVTGNTTL